MNASPPLPRLSPDTLSQVRPGTRLPAYAWRTLPPGIVHLGLGAFVRAHLASYTDDVLAIEPGAVGHRRRQPEARRTSATASRRRTVSTPRWRATATASRPASSAASAPVWSPPKTPQRSSRRWPPAACRIVSLTVTEKGYCHDPATGRLDADHPDIRHDLENPGAPRSAVGLIVAALARRRADRRSHRSPSCAATTCRIMGACSPAWCATSPPCATTASRPGSSAHGAFPSTMVDRIVPATTPADIDRRGGGHRPLRRRAGQPRAVPAMGDRGPFRRCRRARPGKTPARNSWATSPRTSI